MRRFSLFPRLSEQIALRAAEIRDLPQRQGHQVFFQRLAARIIRSSSSFLPGMWVHCCIQGSALVRQQKTITSVLCVMFRIFLSALNTVATFSTCLLQRLESAGLCRIYISSLGGLENRRRQRMRSILPQNEYCSERGKPVLIRASGGERVKNVRYRSSAFKTLPAGAGMLKIACSCRRTFHDARRSLRLIRESRENAADVFQWRRWMEANDFPLRCIELPVFREPNSGRSSFRRGREQSRGA